VIVVFVHGNPETPAVWDLLAARLAEAGHDEQTRLLPPGFGSPARRLTRHVDGDWQAGLAVQLDLDAVSLIPDREAGGVSGDVRKR
jgi:pimeloyl-ACP methyl ester carboxylesterase